MDNIWFIAAFWMGLAFVASLISIRVGISVALIEILIGVIVGNLHTAGQAPLPRYTDLPGEPESEAEAADDYFQERQKEVAEMAAQHGIKVACETRRGHPAKMLVQAAADQACDLIVVGHSDHSEMWGRLLGDTADRISDHAHCSVLIVKN
jgi:nucleotide-binding universal stress UspA family protein